MREQISGAALPPVSFAADIGDARLTGTIDGIYPAALVRHRAAMLKARDLLRAWPLHLALQLVADAPRTTLLFGTDKTWRLTPVADATALLGDLLALYLENLRAPLPLFPESSLEFARRKLQPRPGESASPIGAARGKWFGSDWKNGSRGEGDDPWFQLLHPEDPLDSRWEEVACRIFAPILEHREEIAT